MFRLQRQLKRLKIESAPKTAFKHDLWTRLASELPVDQTCLPRRSFSFVSAVALASVAIVFGMGTGVYAYESPSVVEGHPLHFLKNGLEAVEGRFAISAEERLRFHARMMERRLEEGEHFIDEASRAENALESAAAQLELSVEELIDGLEDDDRRAELLEELASHQERYGQLLKRVTENDSRPLRVKPLRERAEEWGLSEGDHERLFRGGRRPLGE
jgi:hypothetical protein